jgi:hypothetical protein
VTREQANLFKYANWLGFTCGGFLIVAIVLPLARRAGLIKATKKKPNPEPPDDSHT